MRVLLLLLAVLMAPAHAQVYRWIDSRGTVHYSDKQPASVRADKLDIDARPGPPAADTLECHTVRCQGERMEARQARREVLDAQLTAQRVALAPPPVRGLDFRSYLSIQRGMTEGEVLVIAGAPDFQARDKSIDRFTYMPTVENPFVTTIVLKNGRVVELDRARKF